MKNLLLVLFLSLCMSFNSFAAIQSKKQTNIQTQPAFLNVTVYLSCCEITFGENTSAVFLALNSLGLSGLVIASLEARWCSPAEPNIEMYA